MRNWTVWAVGALAVLGSALIAAGVVRGLTGSGQPAATAAETFSPRQLYVRRLFGPWTTFRGAPPGSNRLVMLRRDGTVDVSSWTFPLTPTLPHQFGPALGRIEKQTRTRFRIQVEGHWYGLNFFEPFMVERNPWAVYVVRRAGKRHWWVVFARVSHARRTGHRLPKLTLG